MTSRLCIQIMYNHTMSGPLLSDNLRIFGFIKIIYRTQIYFEYEIKIILVYHNLLKII